MKKLYTLLMVFVLSLSVKATTYTINTAGNTFSPSSFTINVGDTVTWNNTAGNHNVNVTQATFPNNPEGFGNSVGAGWSFQWIFTLAGTYDYQCDPHAPGMSGVIIVNVIPVPGCTDPTACNYDPIATVDDGSCLTDYGCMDPTAFNYDPSATCPDNTCIPVVLGCIDPLACNYDGNANTDNNTCAYSPNISVDSSNFNGFGVSCHGDTNGYINLTVTGGSGNYDVSWTNTQQSGNNLINLSSNTYQYTVSDTNVCPDIVQSVNISQPSALSASTLVTSPYSGYEVSCDGSSDGNITLTFIGDLAVDTYAWSNGASTPNLSGVGAGTYNVIVTDINGCSITTQDDILESPAVFQSGTLGSNQTICYNTVPNTLTNILPTGGQLPYTYNWEKNTGSGWQSIPTALLPDFSPSNLTESTSYRVEYSSSLGCGVELSNEILITVLPQVNPGSILGDQTLCFDSLSSVLTIDQSPTGGNNSYNYQWQEWNGTDWDDITINGVSTTYNPGNMSNTVIYQLEVTSSHDVNCIPTYTNTVTVGVLDQFLSGSLESQDICYNTLPNQLGFIIPPSGADESFTYQWYESADNINFNQIIGEVGNSYNAPSLIESNYYYVDITSDFGCGTIITPSVLVNVFDTFIVGNITSVPTICYNTMPNLISTANPPTGGNTPYSYVWEENDGINGWQPANNSVIDSYQANELTSTTSFRVTYTSANGCGALLSNESEVNVLPIVDPGVIGDNDTLCFNDTSDTLIVLNQPTGGNNNYNFQWQIFDGLNWNDIVGANSSMYAPGNLTNSSYYQLVVNSDHNTNCIDRITDSIYIHVYEPLDAGVIQSDDTICYNDIADPIVFLTNPSGAEGNYSYSWYSSDDNINFNIISGAISSSYSGSNLNETIFYNVIVSSDFGCGSLSTNTIEVTVYEEFLSGTISENDTICYLEPVTPLELSNTTGSDGSYTYQWEYNNGNNWDAVNGAINPFYLPVALDDSTDYRLVVSNAFCNQVLTTNTVNIIVNPLPVEYSVIGDMTVCSNQSDASYTLATTPNNYRYEWSTNDGTIIGTNESRDCLINWPSNPGSTADLEVTVSILETGCKILTSSSITITNNEAPDSSNVILKPNSTILACSDSTVGIHYQWGVDVIATGVSSNLVGDTLQYVQLASVPDTNIERYWVDTYYNYANGISCITRSYYNAPPLPLDVFEVNASNFMIFPNPVTDVLNFNYESDEKIVIQVLDLLGRNVECDIDYSNNKILFNNIKPSIYMLVVRSNKNEFIKKFIIK